MIKNKEYHSQFSQKINTICVTKHESVLLEQEVPQKISNPEDIMKAVPKKISIFPLRKAPLIMEFLGELLCWSIYTLRAGVNIPTRSTRLSHRQS